MAQNGIYNLPNAQARYFADTQRPIGVDTRARIGSATGPVYNPSRLSLPSASTPVRTPAADPSSEYSVLRKTKNPLLETANTALLGRSTGASTANQNDLSSYISKLLTNRSGADAALAQENESINDVFSGKLASQLRGVRNSYRDSANSLFNQGIASADAARKSMSIGSGLGGSSYFARQALGSRNEASAKLATDLADRERRDIDYVRDTQNRLLGLRRKLGTDAAADLLLPTQARSALMREDIGNLAAIQGIDERGNFYGVTDGRNDPDFDPLDYPIPGPTVYGGSVPAGGYFSGPTAGYSPAPRPSLYSRLASGLNASPSLSRRFQPRLTAPVPPGGYGSQIPDNFDDLDEYQQAAYQEALAAAPQYQGNYE